MKKKKTYLEEDSSIENLTAAQEKTMETSENLDNGNPRLSAAEEDTKVDSLGSENGGLHEEVKKQSSLLKKLVDIITRGFRKFKRAWLTVTALGVIIAGVQLWRDIRKPSISEELTQILERNRLAAMYHLPDSTYNNIDEVKDLYDMQLQNQYAYSAMHAYPIIVDGIAGMKIKNKKDATSYIVRLKDYFEYREEINNINIDCITKFSQFYSNMSSKKGSVSKYMMRGNTLEDAVSQLTDYNQKDSLIRSYLLDMGTAVLGANDSLTTNYVQMIKKYSKKVNHVFESPEYKGYFNCITALYMDFQSMINIRLREIEIELAEGRYGKKDDEDDLMKLCRALLGM